MSHLVHRVVIAFGFCLLAWTLSSQAQVATPSISPNGQAYGVAPSITLTCSTSGSSIRYTTNGSDPTLSDFTYSGPFSLYQSATVKAKAWVGGTSSATATASFAVNGSLAAGNDFAFAVRFDRIPQSWGNNANTKLGRTVSGSSATPAPINTAAGSGTLMGVSMVTAGNNGGVALINDGTVRTWGGNTSYQLGANNSNAGATRAYAVTVVNSAGTLDGISMITSGSAHNMALAGSGTYATQIWGWGKNADCQLAQVSSTTPEAFAVRIKADSSGTIFSGAVAIVAGANHSMALKSDGTVWVWGDNTYYQSANNGNTARGFPAIKVGLSNIKFIGSGANHCLAINTSGQLYAWGAGGSGQIGNNATTAKLDTPYAVMGMTSVVKAEGGATHTLALKADGTVWAWGGNSVGQLGDGTGGTMNSRLTPVQVKISATTYLQGIVDISCGDNFSMALGADGTVYVWGDNTNSQLALSGTSPATSAAYASSGAATNIPIQANKPPTSSVVANPTSASELASFTLTGTATIYNSLLATKMDFFVDGVLQGTSTSPSGTGSQQTFTLSNWTNVPYRATPYVVTARATDSGGTVGSISPGTNVTVARQTVTLSSPTASALEGTTTATAFRVSRGATDLNNIAVTVNYTISGTATAGVDYNSLSGSVTIPVNSNTVDIPVTSLTDRLTEGNETVIITLASGNYQFAGSPITFTITDVPPANDPVFYPPPSTQAKTSVVQLNSTAGSTIYYTTDGTTPTATAPASPSVASGSLIRLVPGSTLKAFAKKAGMLDSLVISGAYTGKADVYPAGDHGFATMPDGTTWAWGKNTSGQLGFGDTRDRLTPQILGDFNNAKSIAGADGFTIAVKSDGTVWAWGAFSYSLGDGSTMASSVPVQLAGISNATKVAVGNDYVGILAGGNVYTWGYNNYGTLGSGTSLNRNTRAPVLITGGASLSNVVDITLGGMHAHAVKADGTVWSWGYNGDGQLGLGSYAVTTSLYAVQATAVTGTVQIAAGDIFSTAITTNSGVCSWGSNSSGRLGNGTYFVRTPTPVAGNDSSGVAVTGFYTVAANPVGASAFAAKINGSLYGWGDGSRGQFGSGAASSSPQYTIGVQSTSDHIVSVKAGAAHVLALKNTAAITMWGTGQNDLGQLGDGTQIEKWSPTLIPLNYPDTDRDGIPDWNDSNPYDADSDGDGISNTQELAQGTDPYRADTDGDGVNDNLDAFPTNPALTTAPIGDTTPPIITITFPTQGVTPL